MGDTAIIFGYIIYQTRGTIAANKTGDDHWGEKEAVFGVFFSVSFFGTHFGPGLVPARGQTAAFFNQPKFSARPSRAVFKPPSKYIRDM